MKTELYCTIVHSRCYFVVSLNYPGERLYWSTGYRHSSQSELGSVALDGSSRTLLMQKPESRIIGLAFLGGNLYYIDRFSRYKWMDFGMLAC